MAISALRPDCARANSEPITDESNRHSIGRRGLLGAIVAIPTATMASVGGAASFGDMQQLSPALAQAILYYRRANAVAEHYGDTVYTPIHEAWQNDVANIPHVTTVNSFASAMGERVSLSTSNDGSVAVSRRVLANIDAGKLTSVTADYVATLREVVGGADAREGERERLRIWHGVETARERCDQLTGAALEAIEAVVAIPVRSVADLVAKIAFVGEVDWWGVREAHDAISRDASRLAAGGR